MNATAAQLARERKDSAGRTPLAHLLHALNQPLTGLQCSMELALAELRTPDQHVRTLREALELVARMRTLVEAIRELGENQQPEVEAMETFALEHVLRETSEELQPIAEVKRVQTTFRVDGPLPVRGGRQRLPALVFRLLESALSLAEEGGALDIGARRENGGGVIAVCWSQAKHPPQYSPFSRPELGLLIASAGWEHLGASWTETVSDTQHAIEIRVPLTGDEPKPL